MSFHIRNTVITIWKLRPPSERRDGLIPLRWLHTGYKLERDGDYLCYKLFDLTLILGMSVLALLVADALLDLSIFFAPGRFESNKLILASRFSQIMGPISFTTSLLFYLRIRAGLANIKTQHIPIFYRRLAFIKATRRKVKIANIFMLLVAMTGIWATHICVQRFIVHFEMQNNTFLVMIIQLFCPFATAVGAMFFVSLLLIIEKSKRFFPEFMDDLMANGHDAPWDHKHLRNFGNFERR